MKILENMKLERDQIHHVIIYIREGLKIYKQKLRRKLTFCRNPRLFINY
jgi:hypothetical protein